MFVHNFWYSLKILFKNKMLIFWTFAFPILLGTFFYLAFSNIENSERLDLIPIAIVQNEIFTNNQIFRENFETLSQEESKERLFETIYVEEVKEADNLLEKKKIIGYLFLEEEPKIVVKKSGLEETILKIAVEETLQMESILQTGIEREIQKSMENGGLRDINEEGMQQITTSILEELSKEPNIQDISSSHLSYTMIEFYTLIAMTCLYGGILGMTSMNQNLPNMSSTGKRISVSPLSKGKVLLSSVLASFLVQLIGIALLFIYTIFILKIDYGENIFLIILLAFVGSLVGLSLGIFIATFLKTNENTKTGAIIALTMLGCFLSGMMGITMKYVIDKNIPIVNKLNPASRITDGFYSLYYYSTLDRFYCNVASLLFFTFILLGLSIYGLRRQQYGHL